MTDLYSKFELSKNNHIRYWFNNDCNQIYRNLADESSHMSLGGAISKTTVSFLDSLMNSAREIGGKHHGDFHLFLSGGLDSELAFRSFIRAGVEFRPVIVKFSNNLNIEDVVGAVTLCAAANKDPIIVDFDPLEFFLSEDWKRIAVSYQAHTFYQQLLIKIAENLAAPMITIDEIEISRGDRGIWKFIKKEDQDGCWHRFVEKTGIPAYNNFYTYDPRTIIAFMSSRRIKSLINNDVPGKLSWNSSKNEVYFELTRLNMAKRHKRHGMERMMHIWEYVENATCLLMPGSPRTFEYSAIPLQANLRTMEEMTCNTI